ncbi:hypothetical protein [Moraxella bovis]|uniref:Uncharacterized protein n=1 Tax=Moraxella bovis TaxID=476 RepID=A0A378PYF4_MORBO|nr:hypothetical protein [Moraxella bovis]UZA36831.1 hypothetical protein LP101_06370 [Moraxella bovis]STY93445.1 Uncharacterised protein [Moraxella bovis]
MSNDKRFLMKLLGVFMIEITNVTPEKIGKLLWKITAMICIIIVFFKLPDYINAIKWW